MKALVFSDCHFEFHADHGKSFVRSLPDCEAAIVAGDLSSFSLLGSSLSMLCRKFKHVIYVSGNHDMYGASPNGMLDFRKSVSKDLKNLRWLDCSCAEIGESRIVGTTLWFPMSRAALAASKHYLNDFRMIRGFEDWVYMEHRRSLDFLRKELREGDILVTHHFPFESSIARQHRGSELNPFFYAGPEAELIVRSCPPKIAIHGHTHTSFRYSFGSTHVMCNPAGYAGYGAAGGFENYEFDFNVSIEL